MHNDQDYIISGEMGTGMLLKGPGLPQDEPEAEERPIRPLDQIEGMDDYLKDYGAILGRKAINALSPLHVPNRDPLPDFSDIVQFNPKREPFPAQKDAIAASIKMLDEVGSGFLVGEMGTGKTMMGMVSVHKHAQRSRRGGGHGGKYRCIVLCPDHLISKWCREILETIPGAKAIRFGPQGLAEIKAGAKMKRVAKKKKADHEAAELAGSRMSLRHTLDLIGRGVEEVKIVEGDGISGKPSECPVDTELGAIDTPVQPGKLSGFAQQIRKRWKKPDAGEFYVLGRNQAKWLSDWDGMADARRGFDGELRTRPESGRPVIVERVPVTDDDGRPVYDRRGNQETRAHIERMHVCPKCGNIARNKKGASLKAKDLQANLYAETGNQAKRGGKKRRKDAAQQKCLAKYAVQVVDPDKPQNGLDIMNPLPARCNGHKAGEEFNYGGKRWRTVECKEPFFNYTARPYRWAPAYVMQRKLKGMFDYLVIDEVHEHKSDESAQSMACGKLIGSVRNVLALTGTIIGGYAHHLYALMMRITPETLVAEGFEWGKDLAFSEVYGRIDRIITTKEDDPEMSVSGSTKSMRKAKSGDPSEKKAVRPGVMPTMFGRHLLGSSIFITLDEMADELPDLFEYIGGGCPEFVDNPAWNDAERDAALYRHERLRDGWFDTAVDMDPDQYQEYKRVEGVLELANKDLLRKGCMKLLGAYLWTTTDYPDRPFGWDYDSDKAKGNLKGLVAAAQAEWSQPLPFSPPHVVGYWDKKGNKHLDNWVGVVTPGSLPEERIFPKERRLIDICKKQKADGRQTWVYVQMTGKRNIQHRLKKLLEAEGLRVGVLRSGDVDPKEREDWIAANGRDYDVMISHPQLVSTGLDLFDKRPGMHNYSTIIFYETGYNLFTMRQAARRSWRIGQTLDCRVYYLYYKGSMQHKAMSLMSKKMAAAQALEGEFSEEGLAAMAGEDNVQMALAKSLADRISDADMQRSWSKVKSSSRLRRPTDALGHSVDVLPTSPLTFIPTPLAMLAERLIESEREPIINPDVLDGFALVADRLAESVIGSGPAFDVDALADSLMASGKATGGTTDEDDFVPELSEDALLKMFASMQEHGLLEDIF